MLVQYEYFGWNDDYTYLYLITVKVKVLLDFLCPFLGPCTFHPEK